MEQSRHSRRLVQQRTRRAIPPNSHDYAWLECPETRYDPGPLGESVEALQVLSKLSRQRCPETGTDKKVV